jgi:hypothetical protein
MKRFYGILAVLTLLSLTLIVRADGPQPLSIEEMNSTFGGEDECLSCYTWQQNYKCSADLAVQSFTPPAGYILPATDYDSSACDRTAWKCLPTQPGGFDGCCDITTDCPGVVWVWYYPLPSHPDWFPVHAGLQCYRGGSPRQQLPDCTPHQERG